MIKLKDHNDPMFQENAVWFDTRNKKVVIKRVEQYADDPEYSDESEEGSNNR